LYLTGLVHIQQRRYAKAIDEIRRSIELGGFQEDIGGALGYAYGASGNRAAAENYIAQLEAGLAKGSVGPYALALAHTGLGETTRALMYLNRAIDVHDAFLPEDFFDPLLDGLRRDPRFKRVEARMGLP
jgi:tetratricopeptide (TPR) repeat protein